MCYKTVKVIVKEVDHVLDTLENVKDKPEDKPEVKPTTDSVYNKEKCIKITNNIK